MYNNVNNSQSTAAVNSANITLTAWSKSNFACKSMEITDETFNGLKLSSSLFMFLAEAISDSKINTYFILKDSSSQGCGYCFCLSKNDDGYIVVTEDWSGSDHEYYMGNKKRFTDGNIGIFADRLYDIIADFYYGIYEAEAANNAAEVSETPCLDEAPCLEQAPVLDEKKILEDFCTNEASKIMAAGLSSVALTNEEFYMYDYESLYNYLVDAGFDADRAYEIRDQYESEVDRAIRGLLTAPDFVPVEVSDSDIESTERFWDDITFPYSAKGLAYVKENTRGVDMADILKEVAEFHWDFESVVKESRWTRFTNDSFRDLIWSTCWSEYLVAHTDEALEAETRYVMDFDSVYDDLFGDLWPYMTSYDDSCGGCELWVDSWYVVERAAEIIEESVADSDTRCIDWDEFPDYMMTAFLGDLYGFETFTERVMSELEGGDIVDILPYDDGLYLSFVNDEAEVAA